MVSSKTQKIADACDKITIFSLYATAFFFPISKAIIEISSTLAIVSFLAKKILKRESLPRTPLTLSILAYLSICFFSIFFSANFHISARIFAGKTVQDVLFFFVLIDALSSERRIRNFLYILFLSAALLGVDGIYQYFTHKDFLRHRPAIFVKRIYATFPTPNDFGCYLIAVIPFSVTAFFTKFRLKAARFLLAALFFLLFTCLVMTVSRGAWYAFTASALFLGLWVYPIGLFFLFLALFVAVTQPFYPELIKSRLSNFFAGFDASALGDPGSIERKMFWTAGWKMFMQRPLIGLGLGTFMSKFKQFMDESYHYGPSYAHNCYLQMLAELGIFGLAAFLTVLGLFFYSGIREITRIQEKPFCWYILMASLAAVLGYSVQMAVDTTFYSLDLGILFWVLLGVGAAAMNQLKSGTAALR